jgi:MFS family permease
VLLVYPAVEGREAGWPIWAFICLAAALPVFLLFLYVEQKMTAQGGAPLLDIRLFRNRTFVLGLGMTFLLYSAASFFLTFAIYLENGLGWAPLATSLAILPFGIGFFIAPFTASTLTRYLGVGILLAAYGLLVAGFASVIGELLVYGVPTNAMYGGLFCCGFGMGLSLPSLIRILLQEVPPQESGVAAGMINSALQIGAALNVATVGGVFFSVLGNRSDSWSYAQAFAATLGCVAAGYCISLALAFALWRRKAGDA